MLCYYPDQRYRCTKCTRLGIETFHTAKCPLVIAEQNALEKAKEEHAKTIDTLLIGTSNLRCINQYATNAKVLSSSGSRIGHTANQLRHETTESYKYVIVQTGDNNYDPTINIDERNNENGDETAKEQANKYCKQQNDELELLQDPQETVCDPIHKDSTITILDPLETPTHKNNPNLASQRLRLRTKLKQLAERRSLITTTITMTKKNTSTDPEHKPYLTQSYSNTH